MILPLSDAPFDTPLTFEQASDSHLGRRLQHLGLARGDRLIRLSQEVLACSVRVHTPVGEAVLAPGMAAKVIVHHDNGNKTPIAEMQPGEEGHVEGLVCGSGLEQGLAVLGILENDRITMLRRLPPMDYLALKQGQRLLLTEGEAAKIWGRSQGQSMQFAVAGKGASFIVTRILGGRRAASQLKQKGIVQNVELQLESVRPAYNAGADIPGAKNLGIIQTQAGLRLYLRPDHEAGLLVQV